MPTSYNVSVMDMEKNVFPNATLLIDSIHYINEKGTLSASQKLENKQLILTCTSRKNVRKWVVEIVALLKCNGEHCFKYKVVVKSFEEKKKKR